MVVDHVFAHGVNCSNRLRWAAGCVRLGAGRWVALGWGVEDRPGLPRIVEGVDDEGRRLDEGEGVLRHKALPAFVRGVGRNAVGVNAAADVLVIGDSHICRDTMA